MPYGISLRPLDSGIIVDAKHIGVYALNFEQPILMVSESKVFFDMVRNVGETLQQTESGCFFGKKKSEKRYDRAD